MKLTKCLEGHGYDAEKFDSCPVCAKSKDGVRKAKVVKVKALKQSKKNITPAPVPVMEEKKAEEKSAPAPVKEEKKAEEKSAPAPVKEEKKAEEKSAPAPVKEEKKAEEKSAPAPVKEEKKAEEKSAPAPVKEEKKAEEKSAPAPVKEEKKAEEKVVPSSAKPMMTIEDSPIKKPVKKSLYDNQIIYDADFHPVEEHYKPNEVKASDIDQLLSKNKVSQPQKPVTSKAPEKPRDTKKENEKKTAPSTEQNKPKVNISTFAKEVGVKPALRNEVLPEAAKEHDVGGVKITYSEFKPGQTRAPLARDLKTDSPAPKKASEAKKPMDYASKLDAFGERHSKSKSSKNEKMHFSSERIAELYKDEDIERDETARIDDVNNMALGKDGTLLIKYIGTNEEIKIPSNITTIGKYAFRGNESAKRIIMSDSVKVVDKFAFAHCVHLEEIVFSKNLETIGENAFLKCQRIKELDLPNSLKSIGKGAFGRCSSIRKLVIPSGIKKINDLSFYSCRNLNRVIISGSVESIGNAAFSECYGLKKILISDSVTSIGESAFSWCRSLEEITIPSTVKSVGSWAFYGCQKLTNVKLSVLTKDIKDDAFSGCENVYDVHIAEFDNNNISMNEVKKCHKQVIKILKQINRKKAERYASDHGISTLFL